MVIILMTSEKMDSLALLKIQTFWSKGYEVIISIQAVINKILSNDSNYTVDVVMWLKFGNSRIYMREVIISSIL